MNVLVVTSSHPPDTHSWFAQMKEMDGPVSWSMTTYAICAQAG